MKNYIVYFEMFGKKMKTTILAETETEAKQKVTDKIKWHKVVEKPNDVFNESTDMFEYLKDVIAGNKK